MIDRLGRRTPVAAAGRVVARTLERRRRIAHGRQTLEDVLAGLPGGRPAGGWQVDGGHAASGSRVVFRVAAADRAPVVVKIGYAEADRRSLRAGGRMLAAIAGDDRLAAWRAVVPRLVAEGELGAATFVVEVALPGTPPAWHDEPSRRQLAERAAELAGGLHRATAEHVVADDDIVDAWVRTPMRAIAGALDASGTPASAGARARTARLVDEVAAALAGGPTSASLVHGDFWPGNLLESGGRLSGLVDWDSAHRAPAAVDLVHLLLHLRRGDDPGSIGQTAADVLTDHPWDEGEAAVLASVPPSGLDARTTLLLWWLDFAAGNLARIPEPAASARWLTRNVAVVLDAAEATR